MHLLGFDIGSSSIKAALVCADDGVTCAHAHSPEGEMDIGTPHAGWAEQNPATWWEHTMRAAQALRRAAPEAWSRVSAIGIAYQMHGLVLVDEHREVLRPAIIWCDSRAVEIGRRAFDGIGRATCLERLLNSPANFTAAKLAWVMAEEPDVYARISKMMLPGDYIAMRLSGEVQTTVGGLSEAMLWDFRQNEPAHFVLDYFGFDERCLPQRVPTLGEQARLQPSAASALGLRAGIPISYRAGDQPNNALALRVLQPGEFAASAGTSGVVYGITDRLLADERSRVNGFAHVNHSTLTPRIGMLLCLNGAGSQYRWLRQCFGGPAVSYTDLDAWAGSAPVGSEGLRVFPFGNGAERMLDNRAPGARIVGLDFNRHRQPHLCRAALEGVAFAFAYGLNRMRALGMEPSVIRACHDGLFRSEIFTRSLCNASGCRVDVLHTTGAAGAAKAAGVGAGFYPTLEVAMKSRDETFTQQPDESLTLCREAFQRWSEELEKILDDREID